MIRATSCAYETFPTSIGRSFSRAVEEARDLRCGRRGSAERWIARQLGSDPVEQAAGDLGRLDLDLSVGDQGREGVSQIVVVGRVFALTLLILIVDRTAIANPCEAVEHDRLARPLDQRRVGDLVSRVFQDRKVDAGLFHVPGDVLLGLVGIGD